MDICEGGGRYSVWCHWVSPGHRVRVPHHYSLIEIDSALAGRRSRTLQKRREEERICRREYALILVARLNLPPQVATQIVLLAVPARVFNSGQACDPINVEDIPPVAGGRVARRRRLTEDIVAGFSTSNDNVSGSREVMPTAAPEGFRPTGERTNLIPPPVRSIMNQLIGHMNSDIGMELLPDEAAWPSRPAFLQETTVLDHRLLQMLDALPDGDVLGEIMTYTRSVGQGPLFVGGECPHAWSALWLSEDGLRQLVATGAQASPTAVPPSYDLTGPEQDADLTTEDTGAAKVLKSLDAGRREGAVGAPKSGRGPDNPTSRRPDGPTSRQPDGRRPDGAAAAGTRKKARAAVSPLAAEQARLKMNNEEALQVALAISSTGAPSADAAVSSTSSGHRAAGAGSASPTTGPALPTGAEATAAARPRLDGDTVHFGDSSEEDLDLGDDDSEEEAPAKAVEYTVSSALVLRGGVDPASKIVRHVAVGGTVFLLDKINNLVEGADMHVLLRHDLSNGERVKGWASIRPDMSALVELGAESGADDAVGHQEKRARTDHIDGAADASLGGTRECR